MPAAGPSEDRIDEGRDRGPLGQHDQSAEQNQDEHDGPEPPLLAHAQEVPELAGDRGLRGTIHLETTSSTAAGCQPRFSKFKPFVPHGPSLWNWPPVAPGQCDENEPG